MVITDLDGTLITENHQISETNLATLRKLGDSGIIRVIATGRNMFSMTRSGLDKLPVDYIIFSSGAGIFDCSQKSVIFSVNLTDAESEAAFRILNDEQLDFSIHYAVPENHRYFFIQNTDNNLDFERRNKLYEGYCIQIAAHEFVPDNYCQMIAIAEPPEGIIKYERIKKHLSGLSVVRSTSPIDHYSVWIEVFNQKASKLNGIKFIARLFEIKDNEIFCCGNDYNDLEMLRAFQHAYVVGNAPEEISSQFIKVATHHEDGFTEAVHHWLSV